MQEVQGRQYAISDIHGCLKTFEVMLDKLAFSTGDKLFLLGDLVDRGPDSKGVIDLVWKMQQEGYDVHVLRGNHEQMLLNDLENGNSWGYWSDPAMLKSFGVSDVRGVPEEYVKWIKQLPYFAEADNFLLVHAGFDFTGDSPYENIYEMMWVRNWYETVDEKWLDGRVIVHGHTPVDRFKIENQLDAISSFPVLDIDNGCVYSKYGLGSLCAFDLTNRKLHFQENVE